jgi:hypothetical protein
MICVTVDKMVLTQKQNKIGRKNTVVTGDLFVKKI